LAGAGDVLSVVHIFEFSKVVAGCAIGFVSDLKVQDIVRATDCGDALEADVFKSLTSVHCPHFQDFA